MSKPSADDYYAAAMIMLGVTVAILVILVFSAIAWTMWMAMDSSARVIAVAILLWAGALFLWLAHNMERISEL